MARIGGTPQERWYDKSMSTAKLFQYLNQLGYSGSVADKLNAYYGDMILNNGDPNFPTTGEFVPDRNDWTASVAVVAGTLQLSYFTALKSEAINNVTTVTVGTAAGATPTLCRVGLYAVAANGDLTLEAATANDTTLWANINNAYSRALTGTWNKVVGRRYAAGLLCVTAAATPVIAGHTYSTSFVSSGPPQMAGSLAGQTDLPSNISAGSIAALGRRCGFRLTP